MRKAMIGMLLGILAASFTFDAEAQRRLGGGKNLGRQSQTIQQRQAQFHNLSPVPVAAVWQPPAPVVFDETDSARLAEAVTSAGPPRGNSASEAASTARLPAAE